MDLGALNPARGRSEEFTQGYKVGYEHACKHQAEDGSHNLWDHSQIEKAIYDTSTKLGSAKYELKKARGVHRDVTMNDASFLTFASRDAISPTHPLGGSRRTEAQRRDDALEVEILTHTTAALEAKLSSLLSQKDVMRRHSGSKSIPGIRSACRLAPRSSDIGLAPILVPCHPIST